MEKNSKTITAVRKKGENILKGESFIGNMNKRLKLEQGITMITLVITIIVIIVLSMITIGLGFGENGLFDMANKAKERYEYSNVKEELDIIIENIVLEYRIKEGEMATLYILEDQLPDRLKENDIDSKVFEVNEEDSTLEVYYKRYLFTINGDLETSGTYVGEDITPPIVTFTGEENKGFQNSDFYIGVKIEDTYSEVATSECKYIISKESAPFGDTHSIWDTGTPFEKNEQDIVLNEDTGTYFVHVLAIDTKGNRKEYVSKEIVIQDIVVTDIKITKQPTKTQTIEALPADVTGMEMEVTYNNGKTETITTGFKVHDENRSVGKREVSIEYGGCFTSIEYEWVAKQVSSIRVYNLPVKSVTEGYAANVTGMEVEVTYNNNTTEIITSGFTVTGTNTNTTVGTRNLTVTYQGKTTTVAYTWVTKQPTSIQLIGSPVNKYVDNEIGPNWNGATLKVTYNNGTTASFSPDSCWSNKWSVGSDTQGRYRAPGNGNYSFQFSYTYSGKTVTTSYNYTVQPITGKIIRTTYEYWDMSTSAVIADTLKTGETVTVYRQSDEGGSWYWIQPSSPYTYVLVKDVQLVK